MRIIIFSNIRIYSEGLAKILSDVEGFDIIGTDDSFSHAIENIAHTRPDAILLDMTMPGACQAAQNIARFFPDARIVVLAAPEEEHKIILCVEAGVYGYVEREASLDELIKAIRASSCGEFFYPPRVASLVFNRIRQVAGQTQSQYVRTDPLASGNNSPDALTNRERQIVRLVSEGLSNKQISRELSIEVSTVKNHVHNILVKLNATSRVQVMTMMSHSAFSPVG